MIPYVDQRITAGELQGELRDLLCLAVLGDHVRWVLTGADVEDLGDRLAEASRRWRGLADQVAAHLATLGVPPDGRVRALAKDITLNWVPDGWLSTEEARRLVDQRVRSAAGRTRYRRSQADDADTIDLLDAVRAGLEDTP